MLFNAHMRSLRDDSVPLADIFMCRHLVDCKDSTKLKKSSLDNQILFQSIRGTE